MDMQLSIGKIISEALRISRAKHLDFFSSLMPTILLLIGFTVAWHRTYTSITHASYWFFIIIYCFIFSFFGVACHRLALVSEKNMKPRKFYFYGVREFQFFYWLCVTVICIYFLSGIFVVFISMLLRHVFSSDLTIHESLQPAYVITNIAVTYLYGRICLVFPTTAIDKNADLNESWKLTKNNGWRLMLIAGGLPWIIAYITAFTLRANASLIEIFTISILGYFLLAFQILIISLAYSNLTTSNPPNV